MPLEPDQPITIARDSHKIDFSEKTGSHASESYFGLGTGEGVFGDRSVIERPRKLARNPAAKEKTGQARPQPTSEARRAFRIYWKAAQEAAEAMLLAAEACDLMGVGIAADNLDQSLGDLWKMREGRDIDWRTILNHMQGMMRSFFLEKRAETLTADQCKRIVELVKDYLGPATKTIDDLNEVLRLIDDAGFDPYAAISGDPVSDEKE
jgi:hypothetical protein